MLPWEKDDAPNYYRLYRAALKSIAEKDAQISVLTEQLGDREELDRYRALKYEAPELAGMEKPALTARIRAQRRELAILNRENTKANALAYKRLCELMDARERISVLTAALAQRDEALREACDIARIEYAGEGAVWINNRSRKYLSGVDALSKELAALSAAPRDETCAHEFETLRDPNTPDGPGEIHIVCKYCGAERNED